MVKSNIVLIGFRGAGKSTLAPYLANMLQLTCIDTDEEVERLAGKSISEIFKTEGEARFRTFEKIALLGIHNVSNAVVAVGSGAVLCNENVETIKRLGFIVWLKVNPETAIARIEGSDRPSLTHLPLSEEVPKLLAEREPIYENLAHLTFNTDECSIEEAATLIIEQFIGLDPLEDLPE